MDRNARRGLKGTGGRHMHYFPLLTPDEQRDRAHRMAAARIDERTISSLTGYSVEQIRRVLGEVRP